MIIVTVFLILLLGYVQASLFLSEDVFWEKITVGFFLSTGFLTFLMFLLNLIGFSYTSSHFLMLTVVSIFLFIVIDLLLGRSLKLKRKSFPKIRLGLKIEKIIAAVIGVLFTSSLVMGLYWPIYTWDSLTLYDMRAKVFVAEGFMDKLFSIHIYYLGYPLYTSLLHAISYLSYFSNPHFVYSLIYIFFVVAFYFLVEKFAGKKLSLLFSLILASNPQVYSHSMIAYTNLPYVVFITLGLFYLFSWDKFNNSEIFLSAFLVGMSGWVRTDDPFWMIAIIIFLLITIVRKRSVFYVPIYGLVVMLPRTVWSSFYKYEAARTVVSNLASVGGNDALQEFKLHFFSRFVEVLKYFWVNVIEINFILIVFFAVVAITYFVKYKKTFNALLPILTIILSFAVIFGGIYITSFTYTKWEQVGNSVQRMCMFFVPLILYTTARLLHDVFDEKGK
jgi:hypothetical protein